MIVYHGSDQIVEKPDVLHSYRPLDFGKGFYVTTNPEQAERWARRKADLYHTGIWDKERTIREIKVYPGYDQIAFISQASIDALLKYQSVKEV